MHTVQCPQSPGEDTRLRELVINIVRCLRWTLRIALTCFKRITYFFVKRSRMNQCPFKQQRQTSQFLLIWSLLFLIKTSKTKGIFFMKLKFSRICQKFAFGSPIRIKIQCVLFSSLQRNVSKSNTNFTENLQFLPGWLSGPVTSSISASILSSSGKGLEDKDIFFNPEIKNNSFEVQRFIKNTAHSYKD